MTHHEREDIMFSLQNTGGDSIAYCYLPPGRTMSFFFCTFSLVVGEDRLVFLHDIGEEESSAHLTL